MLKGNDEAAKRSQKRSEMGAERRHGKENFSELVHDSPVQVRTRKRRRKRKRLGLGNGTSVSDSRRPG
jgi:hypothetical protein